MKDRTHEFISASCDREIATTKELRRKAINSLLLMAEEFGELLSAMGIEFDSPEMARVIDQFKFAKPAKRNAIEVVDALADLKVVIKNFEYYTGLEQVVEDHLDVVETANLRKVCMTSSEAVARVEAYNLKGIEDLTVKDNLNDVRYSYIENASGKIMKGLDFEAPEVFIPSAVYQAYTEIFPED